MADPIKVDSHVHLYPTAEDGLAEKESYQIWEYGERADMCFSDVAGCPFYLFHPASKSMAFTRVDRTRTIMR